MNAAIAPSVRSSTAAPFRRIGMTTSGLTVWESSRRRTLPTRRWRTTLIDPVVDPADPPANIRAKSVSNEMTGHSAKSVVANPLVVLTETAERREEHGEHDRERDVQDPEESGGLADPFAERDLRSGELGLHHLPTAYAKPRQHGDGEDDDPHAPEPLRELAPHRE